MKKLIATLVLIAVTWLWLGVVVFGISSSGTGGTTEHARACWTEPVSGSTERICGDVTLAPTYAYNFGDWPKS